MVLKLSRARQHDVGLTGKDATSEYRRRYASASEPSIFSNTDLSKDPDGEEVEVEVPLPSLCVRQGWNAQDPLASVYHYLVFMYVVLPAAFGLRMCFNCPDCNAETDDPGAGSSLFRCNSCADCMGCNGKLMGGFAGLATGLAFATEFQGDGTPHAHGFVSLANMYQHHSLADIGDIISSNQHGLTPDAVLERITNFVEHLQREDHFDNDQHQNDLAALEKEFHDNNFGPRRNLYLSVRPRYFYQRGKNDTYLWGSRAEREWSNDAVTDVVQQESEDFKRRFETDVQFIFSHVQHHWHLLNKKGEREPMPYCRPASRKCKRCKRDFPKKVLKNSFGQVREDRCRARIVCPGVAAELELKTSGRRNALGSIVGKRRCEYFASTCALLAHVTRSNTNVQCNYRVPLMPCTHDKDCKSESCTKLISKRRLCLLAQRAMKQMNGYFGGYISKKQKIGQFELKKSVSTLPLLQEKLEARGLQSASAQLAHVVNRMFTTLESKGILRVATEEFLLSSRYKPHDQLAAEFIRTFRSRNFPGKFFIERYEALCRGTTIDVRVLLPKNAAGRGVLDVVSLYGFRCLAPDIFHLSPWEFVQWMKPVRLEAPSRDNQLTTWTVVGRRKLAEGTDDSAMEPGTDYVLKETFARSCPNVYPFPKAAKLFSGELPPTYERFRQTWILRRRNTPVVPSPEICPMPSRRTSKESRSKIYSVYLRPWTLFRNAATRTVPFLGDLALIGNQPQGTSAHEQCSRHEDMRAAWKTILVDIAAHVIWQR